MSQYCCKDFFICVVAENKRPECSTVKKNGHLLIFLHDRYYLPYFSFIG